MALVGETGVGENGVGEPGLTPWYKASNKLSRRSSALLLANKAVQVV